MAKVVITGATGMVGKGVLLECLKDKGISSVILINRTPIGIANPKITEIIHKDFSEFKSIQSILEKPDACFHCMGISSVGLSAEQYSALTYEVSKNLADLCFEINPDMVFNYVSGMGTDESEKSRQMWARVKGKTENYILARGFRNSFMFRPGFIIPEDGIRSRTKLYDRMYKLMYPLFPVFKRMSGITTTSRIGRAMIQSMNFDNHDLKYLNNQMINKMAAAGR